MGINFSVSLVGAGLGDAGLLTIRAQEVLQQADVVLYDALVHPDILKHCHRAEKIYVGKRGFAQQTSQEEIHQLLIQHAQAGRHVVRLKGGDPFVFGRGGEEALALREAGIPFQIIPGISSALAAAAYAGIPVTHRGMARHFAVMTGHDLQTEIPRVDTLIILMGIHNRAALAQRLLSTYDPKTPVAVVQRASYIDQKTTLTTLDQLSSLKDVQSPAVLIVGQVALLHEQLAWKSGPLHGIEIVVTRTRQAPSELAQLLRRNGASVTEIPLLNLSFWGTSELQSIVKEYAGWVIFSSEYAVHAMALGLDRLNLDFRSLSGWKIAAVGTGTARALKNIGLRPDYVPTQAGALFLAKELLQTDMVIHLGAEEDTVLQHQFLLRGIEYILVPIYRSEIRMLDDQQKESLQTASVVTLSSSVAARALAQTGTHYSVLSIGPQTTKAAHDSGFTRIIQSQEASLEGMLSALINLNKNYQSHSVLF